MNYIPVRGDLGVIISIISMMVLSMMLASIVYDRRISGLSSALVDIEYDNNRYHRAMVIAPN